jgi:hypothetical protein
MHDSDNMFVCLVLLHTIACINREVTEATELLVTRLVPALARHLCSYTEAELLQLDIAAECHFHGVNMRHCGLVRYMITLFTVVFTLLYSLLLVLYASSKHTKLLSLHTFFP